MTETGGLGRICPVPVITPKLETKIGPLCDELGVTKQTLYRHVSPTGELREDGKKLLEIN